MYCDAGLDFVASAEPLRALARTEPSGVVSFQMAMHSERQYTKRGVLQALGCTDAACAGTGQRAATFILFRAGPAARRFVAEWLRLCQDPYLLADDFDLPPPPAAASLAPPVNPSPDSARPPPPAASPPPPPPSPSEARHAAPGGISPKPAEDSPWSQAGTPPALAEGGLPSPPAPVRGEKEKQESAAGGGAGDDGGRERGTWQWWEEEDGFVAHRHDQSIFSVLCKRWGDVAGGGTGAVPGYRLPTQYGLVEPEARVPGAYGQILQAK